MNKEKLPKPVVIGLRGVAGAGKTTIQKLLVERIDKAVAESVAGPLKTGLAIMGVTKQNHPGTYRRMAQLVGATMREIDENWWSSQASLWWQQRLRDGWVFVVDDIRYENERDLCDYVFYIEAGFPAGLTGDEAKHESERMNSQGAGSDHFIFNPSGAPEVAAGRILQTLLDNPILRSKL